MLVYVRDIEMTGLRANGIKADELEGVIDEPAARKGSNSLISLRS